MKNFKDFDENDDVCFTFKVDYWCDQDVTAEQFKIDAELKRQKRKEKLDRILKEL